MQRERSRQVKTETKTIEAIRLYKPAENEIAYKGKQALGKKFEIINKEEDGDDIELTWMKINQKY